MAQRRSKADIFRSEKYMDDAVFSAFLNLHKAAKRKSEYVWAMQKFTSVDSIWGLDETPKVSTNQKPLLQNSGSSNEGIRNEFECSNPANKILNADEKSEIRLKQTLKRSQSIDNRASDTRYEFNQEISQRKQNFRGIGALKTEDPTLYISRDAEKKLKLPSLENTTFNVALNAEKNESGKSDGGETEFKNSCMQSKLNYSDKPRKEKSVERVKRKRQMSSSVNSLYPEYKHFSVGNQKHDPADKRSIILKTMLELKIFKGEKGFDFTLELSDFNRMKKKFPKLEEVLPEIDSVEKELNYSADAVKIVFGFLRNLRYPTPDERTGIEVLAASKSWEMFQFHDEFKQKFSENLPSNNVRLAYGAAVHYGLREICDAYSKCALGDDLPSSKRPYRPRKCYVSVSKYIEPIEFCFPSKTSISRAYQDNFDKDIKNEIRFKAIAGSYVITGFHILLNIDNETDSINLEFGYVVKNFESSYEEELKVSKPLRRNIVIYLKKRLEVNQGETAEIVVDSSIKPYLCSAIQENNIVGRCGESHQFSLNVTSTYKVEKSNEKRFFVEKLLYYPKT